MWRACQVVCDRKFVGRVFIHREPCSSSSSCSSFFFFASPPRYLSISYKECVCVCVPAALQTSVHPSSLFCGCVALSLTHSLSLSLSQSVSFRLISFFSFVRWPHYWDLLPQEVSVFCLFVVVGGGCAQSAPNIKTRCAARR